MLTYCLLDYHKYKDVYDSCPESLDISKCPAAQRQTTLTRHLYGDVFESQVAAPMPGIIPFSNDETDPSGKIKYRYWQCGSDQLIDTHGLTQSPDFNAGFDMADQTVGVCQADQMYVWGFSFLFAVLVAIFHVVFAFLMYALWLWNWKDCKSSNRAVAAGIFPDAVTMVTQAQKQHGIKLDEWTPSGLKREIVHGMSGMSFRIESLRGRKADGSEALGDGHAGDWGGDVFVDVDTFRRQTRTAR